MNSETLATMQRQQREDRVIPVHEVSLQQLMLKKLDEISSLLTEICIELKEWRTHSS